MYRGIQKSVSGELPFKLRADTSTLVTMLVLKKQQKNTPRRRKQSLKIFVMKTLTKQDFYEFKVTEPTLIRLAGMYDVWDHRDPDAKALQFGLRSLDQQGFGALVHYQLACGPAEQVDELYLKPVIKAGHAIKSYCDKQNDEYSATYSRTLDWEGLRFCCLNIGQRGNSDLVRGGLKPEHQAIFAWRHTGDGVMVSLYHAPGHEDLDLSAIAKRYGGGGHRGACGFRFTLKQLAEILP